MSLTGSMLNWQGVINYKAGGYDTEQPLRGVTPSRQAAKTAQSVGI